MPCSSRSAVEPSARPVALVVEDHELIRRLIVQLVGRAGFDTREASSAEEAIAILPDMPLDTVMVLDWRLPRLFGGAVAAAARRRNPAAPIVIVSDEGSALAWAGVGEGWVFLSKPCTLQELIEGIERARNTSPRPSAGSPKDSTEAPPNRLAPHSGLEAERSFVRTRNRVVGVH